MSVPQLDPALLERYAGQLERKATSVRRGSIFVGALLGAALGAVPLSPLGDYLPLPSSFVLATILVGAAVGGLFGHVIGAGRAFNVRVQAQLVVLALQGKGEPEPSLPAFEPAQLLPIRRPTLEAVPKAEPRLEAVPQLPPLSPTAG